ncbi:polymorphic toxin type 44 domain-containing protein [Paramaledivibacter caminithermalis]|jgi:virulence-associated protein VapD|uniref:Toxin 44 n=1 Tax=Paramaledivibacter caminithermalis (strain DSM 15212 / CIP 107654 / DViRD3) TaxID=1121301 RepID=A0A1M6TY41_PARC5|nr:polymorphic toxin type 44 domain-containing protein [Paramaledivibacter caminithermalis]SHK61887.1 toxin 44 [Paramaledivibacter caminithermalis DSM 15212]
MKKFNKIMSLVLILIIFLGTVNVYACSNLHNEMQSLINEDGSKILKSENLKNLEELHNYISNNISRYVIKNQDGTVTISKQIYKINISPYLIKKYITMIDEINKGVKLGIIYFDKNLSAQVIDDVENYVYNRGNNTLKEYMNNYSTKDVGIMSLPDEPPYFNITYTCHKNAKELQDVYDAAEATRIINPNVNPWLVTVGYWAGKVREGGDWDYKRELGWNTEYKIIIGGKVDYVHGEDIGNIHYGYTGRSIGFSQFTLKSAAGLVQVLSGTAKKEWFNSYFDDPKDQYAIQRGIDMYNNGL